MIPNYRLQKIDELLIKEHSCLEPNDKCFFFGEYAGKKGYQHSPINQLIFNLKKEPTRKEELDWHYKEKAILFVADLISSSFNSEKLKETTWIPFPPSKKKNDSRYDDRLVKILEKVNVCKLGLDVRELLFIKQSRESAHREGRRFTIEEHLENLSIDRNLLNPTPKMMIIFDDVITSGASFKAAQKILSRYYSNVLIEGVFIARSLLM